MLGASYTMIWITSVASWVALGFLSLSSSRVLPSWLRSFMGVAVGLLLFPPWALVVLLFNIMGSWRDMDPGQLLLSGTWQLYYAISLAFAMNLGLGLILYRFLVMKRNWPWFKPALSLVLCLLWTYAGLAIGDGAIHTRLILEQQQALAAWKSSRPYETGEEKDASRIYKRALEGVTFGDGIWHETHASSSVSQAERDWLAKRKEQLHAVLAASRQNDIGVPFKVPRNYQDPLPFFGEFKRAGQLLCLDARVAAAEGDWQRAYASIDALRAMARQLSGHSTLVAANVAARLENLATKTLEIVLNEETVALPEGPSAPSPRITGNDWLIPNLHGALKNEAYYVSFNLEKLLYPDSELDSGLAPDDSLIYRVFFGPDDLRRVQMLRSLRERSRKQEPATWEELGAAGRGFATGLHRYKKYNNYVPFIEEQKRVAAGSILAEMALAASHYRVANGVYPQSLEQLLGLQLDMLPNDPYSGVKPVLLVVEDVLILYSLGPNGSDDGPGDYGDKEYGVVFFLKR